MRRPVDSQLHGLGGRVANDNALARPRRHARFMVGGLVSFLLVVAIAVAIGGRHVCEHPRGRDDRGGSAHVAELVPPPASPVARLLSIAPPVSLAFEMR